MSYFLIAVSTRENLELCVRYALAGFPSSISGLWAYLDIQEGDFLSFLYGARAYNLYEVESKAAYKDADRLPPWPPLVLRPSGRIYNFPFRLHLRQFRVLEEPLVRAEFAYVAENLLLRGGYRKSHFQADQTTLQNVSEMGLASSTAPKSLETPRAESFIPSVVRGRAGANQPYVFPLRELIVQTLLRRHLSAAANLHTVLGGAGVGGLDADKLEVLGEKAFPEGHVDILIKEATPLGMSRKVVVEVKLGRATNADAQQLSLYMERLGEECAGGVLVAGSVGSRIRNAASGLGIACMTYGIAGLGAQPMPHDKLLEAFSIAPVSG